MPVPGLRLFGNFIGLILDRLLRKRRRKSKLDKKSFICPKCNISVEKDPGICPKCGKNLIYESSIVAE